jgi:hypothetical protein
LSTKLVQAGKKPCEAGDGFSELISSIIPSGTEEEYPDFMNEK